MTGFFTNFNDGKAFVVVVCCLTFIGVVKILTNCILRIFCGYPPVPPLPKQECPNEDNLTGVCLRHDGCKTVEKCNLTVEGWYRPVEEEQ